MMATIERMRIDSSGNVLVGKTTETAYTTVGFIQVNRNGTLLAM